MYPSSKTQYATSSTSIDPTGTTYIRLPGLSGNNLLDCTVAAVGSASVLVAGQVCYREATAEEISLGGAELVEGTSLAGAGAKGIQFKSDLILINYLCTVLCKFS